MHVKDKCKCGHLKSEHKKSWWKTTFCNLCQCEDYLKFNAPGKWGILELVYGFFMIGLVSLMVITAANVISSIPQEELDKPADVTLGGFLGMGFIVVLLIFLVVTYIIIDCHIAEYFKDKRRRIF